MLLPRLYLFAREYMYQFIEVFTILQSCQDIVLITLNLDEHNKREIMSWIIFIGLWTKMFMILALGIGSVPQGVTLVGG